MKIYQITVSVLFFLACASYSQTKSAPKDVIVYCYKIIDGYEKFYLNARKGNPYEVKLTTSNTLGEYQTTLTEGKLSLLEIKRNDKGETFYDSFLDVSIPSSIKKPLVFLVPNAKDKNEPYKYFVFEWDTASFKPGSYKFINFSPHPIRGLIGKSKVDSKPRKVVDVDITNNDEKLVQIQFKFQREDDWKDFAQGRWPINKEKRTLLCAFLDEKSKRMMMKGIPLQPIIPERHRG